MNNLNLYVKGEVKKQQFLQNISTRQLAEMLGMDYQRVGKALRHGVYNPAVMYEICNALKINASSVTKDAKPVSSTHELIAEVRKQMYIHKISIAELALKLKCHYSAVATFISGGHTTKFSCYDLCELFDIPWEGDHDGCTSKVTTADTSKRQTDI